jgi:hypothetical protein
MSDNNPRDPFDIGNPYDSMDSPHENRDISRQRRNEHTPREYNSEYYEQNFYYDQRRGQNPNNIPPQYNNSSQGIPYPSPVQRQEAPKAESEQPDLLEGTKVTTGKAVAFAVAFSGVVATEYVKLNTLENGFENLKAKVEDLRSTDAAQAEEAKNIVKSMEVLVKEVVTKDEARAKENIETIEELISELKTTDALKYKEIELKVRELSGLLKELEQKSREQFNELDKIKIQEKAEMNERLQFIENKLRTLLLNTKKQTDG